MFQKPNAIVYLRKKDLIVGGKRITPAKMSFSSDLVKNMEIQNPETFISNCQDFFTEHALKGKKVQIILDQNIVFEKNIDRSSDNSEDLDYITQIFTSQIPFSPGKRSCIQDMVGDMFNIYATNADLYRAIVEALNLAGARKVVAITPSAAYQVDFNVKFSEIMKLFIEDKNIRKNANFSTAEIA